MTRFTLLGTVLLLVEPALRVALAVVLLAGRRSAHARGIARAAGVALTVAAIVLLTVMGAGASRLMAGSLGSVQVLEVALLLAAAVVVLYGPAIWLLLRVLGRDAWRFRMQPADGEAQAAAVDTAMYAAALCLVVGSAVVWLTVGLAALLV
jgi:hypothetical protein